MAAHVNFKDRRAEAESFLGKRGSHYGSKGQYCHDNPRNLVVFNANVCTREDGKIWYGDLDITIHESKLWLLAKALGKEIYVLYEMDGRFEHESSPRIENALYVCQGNTGRVSKELEAHTERVKGRLILKENDEEKTEREPQYPTDAEQKNFQAIALPDLQVILQQGDQEESPLLRFYRYVANELQAEIQGFDVTRVSVTPEIGDALRKSLDLWLKISFKHLTSYRLQSEASWIWLDIGPNVFKPEWAKNTQVYWKIESCVGRWTKSPLPKRLETIGLKSKARRSNEL